jgi:hypothetical protein
MPTRFPSIRPSAARIALASLCVTTLWACGGQGGGDSPTVASPSNTNLTGTWIGTMTRPAGLGTITTRWVATQADFVLSGPFSMTYNGVTLETKVSGTIEGGSGTPGAINFNIRLNAGEAAALPGCSIFTRTPPVFTGFPPGATSLSTTFDIQYTGCQGFIAPDANTTQRIETTTLTMNKQ